MIENIIKNHLSIQEDIRTDLCESLERNGSDKSTWHNYSSIYKKLFSVCENETINFLEVGLGTNYTDVPSNMGIRGVPGASLYAFSETYPKWNIFGLDVDKRVLFQNLEKRISTFFVDQLDETTIHSLWNTSFSDKKFDIIIDDGLHEFDANVNFYKNSIHMLNENGIFIIEDILNEQLHLFEQFSTQIEYDNYLFTLPYYKNQLDNNLMIVQKCKNDVRYINFLKKGVAKVDERINYTFNYNTNN